LAFWSQFARLYYINTLLYILFILTFKNRAPYI
jgi:hypothetical protein